MSVIPYPGLRPFKREESDIFFGREVQTDQLLEKLSQTHFISVVGLSGCGKSSLVRAGMIAALETGYMVEAGPYWQIAAMRPGNRPLHNLVKTLLADTVLGAEWEQTNRESLSDFIASQGSLGLVKALREIPLPRRTNLLLLVDQFEEIFRYQEKDISGEIEAFVALLLTSGEQREIPIYVVITMRSEFIGECARFRDLPEMMNMGQFLVPRLTQEQQRMAIVGPARVFNGDLEPRLLKALLNEMGDDPDQLPLLQHCLMRIWARSSSRNQCRLEDSQQKTTMLLEDYEEVGKLKSALSRHADEAFEELDAQGQSIAETMFRWLSERDPEQRDTRRPASLKEIAVVAGVSEKDVAQVAEVFRSPDRSFIMPVSSIPLTSDTMLDISHESLIRQWERMKQWVIKEAESAEIYRRLEQTAILWKQNHAALWRTPDLEIALNWKEQEKPTVEWASRYSISPTFVEKRDGGFKLAMEFLHASEQEEKQKQAELERQRAIKLKQARRQLAVVLVGLIIALGFGVWAFVERRNAESAKAEMESALRETQEARSVAESEKVRAQKALADAENAREIAEKQEQRASEAEKKAQDALTIAESNSNSFAEMVNATFGFLSETDQGQEFLGWIEDTLVIERLLPTLKIMIDSSETMDDAQKQLWHDKLLSMTKEEKVELLGKLGTEAAQKIRGAVSITQINITSIPDGNPFQNDRYFLKIGGTLSIEVTVDNPYNREIRIAYSARQGKVQQETPYKATYIAPNTPVRDTIAITVLDAKTERTLANELRLIHIME